MYQVIEEGGGSSAVGDKAVHFDITVQAVSQIKGDATN